MNVRSARQTGAGTYFPTEQIGRWREKCDGARVRRTHQRQVGAVPLLLRPPDISQRLVAVTAARQAVELRSGQRREVVEGRPAASAGARLALLAGGHGRAGLTHLSCWGGESVLAIMGHGVELV